MKYNFKQNRSDYLTPPELIQKVLMQIGLSRFDLDVCCSSKNIPAYEHFIYKQNDGLKENWQKYNWCNPPYDEADKWVKKAYEEQQKGNTTVMLLPVRTETKYWHDYILFNKNVKIEWLRKGIRFLTPETKEPMGIFKNALTLVYFNGIR